MSWHFLQRAKPVVKIPFRFGLKDEFRPKGNSPGEYLFERAGKLFVVNAKKSECIFSGFI